MAKQWGCLFICVILSLAGYGQQKPRRQLSFCGWRYEDTAVIRQQFEKQLAFLQIADKDTIVDIGSSSGAFEGCLSVIGNYTNVHFILVDIDSNCLNNEKLANMQAYYSGLTAQQPKQQYAIVLNTPDSLFLPANRYQKTWLMNTLHEIPDKQKMVRDIREILRPGGELVLTEIVSRPGHTIHGGCKQALLDEHEIKTLFEQNGFRQANTLWNPTNTKSKKIRNPYYMVRFIKN